VPSVTFTIAYPVGWHLCFVWIGDAFRRQGLLLKRWPHWVTQYGLFTIECPVSDSFQSFLRKVDYAGLKEELKVRLKEYIEKKADKLEYA
jgi:hypothetical protein